MPAGRRLPGTVADFLGRTGRRCQLGQHAQGRRGPWQNKMGGLLTTTPLLFSPNDTIEKKNTRPFGNDRILTEEIKIILAASASPH